MTWITRSLPPEPDLPPPDPPPAPPRRVELEAELDTLRAQIRPRVRSARQERIRSRIAIIVRELLIIGTRDGVSTSARDTRTRRD